jgi:hypothetical protein
MALVSVKMDQVAGLDILLHVQKLASVLAVVSAAVAEVQGSKHAEQYQPPLDTDKP